MTPGEASCNIPRSPAEAAALANAGVVILLCERLLQFQNIPNSAGATLIGRRAHIYAMVQIDYVSSAGLARPDIPVGAITLSPACLVSFLPAVRTSASSAAAFSGTGYGRIGLAIMRENGSAQLRFPNMWWAGSGLAPDPEITREVLDRITYDVLPFFELCDRPGELLRVLQGASANETEPMWDIGRSGSLRRLLAIGYTAIACSEWQTAEATLIACQAKLDSVRSVSSEAFCREYAEHIQQGLACASAQRAWRPESVYVRAWQDGAQSILRMMTDSSSPA